MQDCPCHGPALASSTQRESLKSDAVWSFAERQMPLGPVLHVDPGVISVTQGALYAWGQLLCIGIGLEFGGERLTLGYLIRQGSQTCQRTKHGTHNRMLEHISVSSAVSSSQ